MPPPCLPAYIDSEKLTIAGSEIWELSPLTTTNSSLLRVAENSNGEKRVLKAVKKVFGEGGLSKNRMGFGGREVDISCRLDEVREKSTHFRSFP